MNYLRTHYVCLRLMLRPSHHIEFFGGISLFCSVCYYIAKRTKKNHWWIVFVVSLSPCMCANAAWNCVILCYFQYYLYNIGLNATINGTHIYKYKQQFVDNMWYIVRAECVFFLSVSLSFSRFFRGLCLVYRLP